MHSRCDLCHLVGVLCCGADLELPASCELVPRVILGHYAEPLRDELAACEQPLPHPISIGAIGSNAGFCQADVAARSICVPPPTNGVCPAGYVLPAGVTACQACAPGTYSSMVGAAACQEFSPGTFPSSSGNTVCYRCAPGTFGPSFGQVVCQLCMPGTLSASQQALRPFDAQLTRRIPAWCSVSSKRAMERLRFCK